MINKLKIILSFLLHRYFISGLIIIFLPLFYILFNTATPRYIYFPNLHIYGATISFLVIAISLIFIPKLLRAASIIALTLLSSWLIQNIGFSMYYSKNLIESNFLYWFTAIVPIGVCIFIYWYSYNIEINRTNVD